MKKLIVLIVLTLFSVNSNFAQSKKGEVPLIPMKDFFKNPEKTAFQISPNGEYLAFMMPWESRLNIYVQKIGATEAKRLTSATERDIAGYFWANNDRVAYVQDKGGDENFRLYAVNIDGTNEKDLTPFEKVRVDIIDDLEENPDEMIIAMNKNNPQLFDVYRININTGELKEIASNPGNITSWVTDHDGKLRVAITTDGVNNSLLYRENENDEFHALLTTSFRETVAPAMFTFDNKNLYMISNIGRDKLALTLYNLKDKKEEKVIYSNDEVDIDNVLASKKMKKLTGVSYTKAKRSYHFLDEGTEKVYKELSKLLPGYEIAISGKNKNEDKLLVRTYSDKTRGSFYFYNVTTKEFIKLADVSPWLDEANMAEMKPITYKARDGKVIHGYLTLPKGKVAKNLPVVVNPHGGPWARDSWGFNPEVQFLANRGYAVLQMNFRGSTGFGKEFWMSSFKQWGKTMQDDITDGVEWLKKEGIADPKRIGIYGGSYGGYATLAGLTFTPELYACGVDYVGVSNLFTFMNSIPPYWKPYLDMLYEMVGHPEKDSALLHSASPVFHVDKIKAPLFIAQGANDPRVVKSESDQMVEALKKNGIDVPYLVKDNEGHGFRNEENRFEFYKAMEDFLGKYLGGSVGTN
ncbi:MAG TPA: S9 family peptidase [Ignavibacteriaceae bacterium]|nr:S9 family peptidase [Ignavibacteriaceae bacterium]